MAAPEAATQQASVREPVTLFAARTRRDWVAGSGPAMERVCGYDAANFISLMASKFCTPPPTLLVV
jgi:hypothetical protein